MKTINYMTIPVSELLATINVAISVAEEVKLSVDSQYIQCIAGSNVGMSILNDIKDTINKCGHVDIEAEENDNPHIFISDDFKLYSSNDYVENTEVVSISVYHTPNRVTRSCTESSVIE